MIYGILLVMLLSSHGARHIWANAMSFVHAVLSICTKLLGLLHYTFVSFSVSAAWITSMMASWFYKQFQLLATAVRFIPMIFIVCYIIFFCKVETVLKVHLFSGVSMTAVAFPKMLQNHHVSIK